MRRNAKLKEKQKWSHEKLHLENARKFNEIYRRYRTTDTSSDVMLEKYIDDCGNGDGVENCQIHGLFLRDSLY